VQDLTTPVPLAWMTQICFGSSGFGSVNLSTLAFSGVLTPEVDDPSTCVSHRSTTANHFGSSGFGSFNLSTLAFSRSAYTRSRRSIDMCPFSQIDDTDKTLLLRGFPKELTTIHLATFLGLTVMIRPIPICSPIDGSQ
jgi:hypothetical protein